jgi:hypothetical protein
MADEITNTTVTTEAAAPKRAAAKRKAAPKKAAAASTTAARKAPAKRATANKNAVDQAEAKVRTYKRRATKASKEAEKSAARLSERARTVGRNAFLASLGFYGKAFDEMQVRLDKLQTRLDARGKAAEVAYAELVKRGTKVEKDAKSRISDIELPKLELDALKDRKKLEARLEQARTRFTELRESVSFRSAA